MNPLCKYQGIEIEAMYVAFTYRQMALYLALLMILSMSFLTNFYRYDKFNEYYSQQWKYG